MRICNSFFITQLLSVQSILSGDMSLWAICILICFSWFLCWEFVEAHDLHGERPQHQSMHYHSAHYHQRHRRHWVSTSEQFVECLWCRVNYDGPPDHKKIRHKFVYFLYFFSLIWLDLVFALTGFELCRTSVIYPNCINSRELFIWFSNLK